MQRQYLNGFREGIDIHETYLSIRFSDAYDHPSGLNEPEDFFSEKNLVQEYMSRKVEAIQELLLSSEKGNVVLHPRVGKVVIDNLQDATLSHHPASKGQLDSETSARTSAISAEASARTSKDAELEGRIVSLEGVSGSTRLNELEEKMNQNVRRVLKPNLALGVNDVQILDATGWKDKTCSLKGSAMVRKADKSNAYSFDCLLEVDDEGVLSLIGYPNLSNVHEDLPEMDCEVTVSGSSLFLRLTAQEAGGSAMIVSSFEELPSMPVGSVSVSANTTTVQTDFNRVYSVGGVKKLKASLSSAGDTAWVGKQCSVAGLPLPVNGTVESVSGNVMVVFEVTMGLAEGFYGQEATYTISLSGSTPDTPAPPASSDTPISIHLAPGYSPTVTNTSWTYSYPSGLKIRFHLNSDGYVTKMEVFSWGSLYATPQFIGEVSIGYGNSDPATSIVVYSANGSLYLHNTTHYSSISGVNIQEPATITQL